MDDGIRQYTQHTVAWPIPRVWPLRDGATEEIMFGLNAPDGGTYGECAVRWYKATGPTSPRLEAFSDCWKLFSRTGPLRDVIDVLFRAEDWTVADFLEALNELGFKPSQFQVDGANGKWDSLAREEGA